MGEMFKTGAHLVEEHDFTAIIVENGVLAPVNFRLSYSWVARTDDPRRDELKIFVANHKIKFWVESVLDDIIIADSCDTNALTVASVIDNMVMLTPGQPITSLLVELLYSKLYSILEPIGVLLQASLKSYDSGQTANFIGEKNYYVADSEYLEDIYHNKPWWQRASYECMDFTQEEIAIDESARAYIESQDQLELFEHELIRKYKEETAKNTGKKSHEAKIIKLPKKWKPKVI